MRERAAVPFGIVAATALTLLAASPAQAAYSRTTVNDAWKFAPNLESTISSQDDAYSSVINLPFPFPFQDDVFTQLRIHTNGFVTLGSAAPTVCGGCYTGQQLGNLGHQQAPNYTIAPWWADWDPGAEGDIFFGPVDGAFVVEWWFVRAFGAAAGQTYAFSLQMFADGHFNFLYRKVDGGNASRDFGNTASIGLQGRPAARYGVTALYKTGSGGTLTNGLVWQYNRASDNLPLSRFDKNPSVPDIVERWAPVIWNDTSGDGRCDMLTNVDFDGDLKGSNNQANWLLPPLGPGLPLPANVYFSVVETTTHWFIGYYFYHPRDCSEVVVFGGHEHDWEGVMLAVNKTTGSPDAMLTNVHGTLIPYRSPFLNLPTLPTSGEGSDFSSFSFYTVFDINGPFDTVGVGVESITHAVWGRWHNKCVIGPEGSPSGCDDSHGGDGILYQYGNTAGTVGTIGSYPNWPSARTFYQLIPLSTLYAFAQNQSFCGQDQATALFACDGTSKGTPPWDMMNGQDLDKADLPWVWGRFGPTKDVCHASAPNLGVHPGVIFRDFYTWPAGRLDACNYVDNQFRTLTTCTPLLPACPP